MAEFFHDRSLEIGGSSHDTQLDEQQIPDNGEIEFLNPGSGNYFQAVPRLNELRIEVSNAVGPSACDLIKRLNLEAIKAGFEPVGANCRGVTADDFFKANPVFTQLEDHLLQKLVPENVSEVFELIKDASYYKPTRRIVNAIEGIYLKLLEQRKGSQQRG